MATDFKSASTRRAKNAPQEHFLNPLSNPYWIVERQSAMVKILSELFVQDGLIGYIVNERVDGKLIRPEAIKSLEIK